MKPVGRKGQGGASMARRPTGVPNEASPIPLGRSRLPSAFGRANHHDLDGRLRNSFARRPSLGRSAPSRSGPSVIRQPSPDPGRTGCGGSRSRTTPSHRRIVTTATVFASPGRRRRRSRACRTNSDGRSRRGCCRPTPQSVGASRSADRSSRRASGSWRTRRACGPQCPDSGSSGRLKVSLALRSGHRNCGSRAAVASRQERGRVRFVNFSFGKVDETNPAPFLTARRPADPLRLACRRLGSTLPRVAQGAPMSSRRHSGPQGPSPGVPPWPRFPSSS